MKKETWEKLKGKKKKVDCLMKIPETCAAKVKKGKVTEY